MTACNKTTAKENDLKSISSKLDSQTKNKADDYVLSSSAINDPDKEYHLSLLPHLLDPPVGLRKVLGIFWRHFRITLSSHS
jgi:prephenate dehydratase